MLGSGKLSAPTDLKQNVLSRRMEEIKSGDNFITSDFLGFNLATIIFLRYFVFCLSQGSFTFVREFVFNLHYFTKFFCGANKPYLNISKEVLRSKHAQCQKKFRLIA